ncbi:hypothetical protein OSTOST_17127, partial [Ostertagia ostertagi]
MAIAARLTHNILLSVRPLLEIESVLFLCDSEIALNWLQSSKHRQGTSRYVSNRIKDLWTQSKIWRTAQRGLSSSEFSNHDWWKGHTLKEIQNNGFKLYTIQEEDGEPETVVTNYVKAIANEDETVKEIVELSAYNELRKVRRIVAYALRFLKGIHSRLQGALKEKLQTSLPWIARKVESQSLSATETKDAELILIKQHQAAHLQSQYRKELVKNLNVREDKNKILRAYGRLNKADLDADAKNPIVIAPKSEISRLIIIESHGAYHKSKRSQWKMAKITKLVTSSDGEVREAEVLCAKHNMRRPVNQLYPLEITGYNADKDAVDHPLIRESTDPPQRGHYNLRPRRSRRQPNDTAEATVTSVMARRQRNPRTWPLSLYLKMALVLVTMATPAALAMPKREPNDTPIQEVASKFSPEHLIECAKEGVFLHAPGLSEFELCVDSQCIEEHSPPIQKIIKLPSEILLHDYEIKWKIRHENEFIIVERMCPALPFCPAITCTICSANLLNPECWPVSAILGVGALLYIIIIICHTMCCVP